MLRASNVTVAPPGAAEAVVSGVSLEIAAGEWVALTGPNGSGKTSLALALAGLWQVRSGRVTVEGAPLESTTTPSRRGIATVLQDPSTQILQSSVGEELAFTARNLGLPEEAIERDVAVWRERLGFEVEAAEDPRRLPAGRQQLLLLVAALVSRPRLLVADEAAAHLDADMRDRLLRAIREEVARGLAVLWVGQHDRELEAADRTVRLSVDRPRDPGVARPSGPADRSTHVLLHLEIHPLALAAGPRVLEPAGRTLVIASHGITAVVGRNGVGKTVLLHSAAGVGHAPQVEVVWKRPRTAPPLLATQFPEDQIFEERVEDEVIYAAVQRGVPRDRALQAARESFAELGLEPGFGRKRPWNLSGGEKRLVSVLSALLAPSSLVVLDEPTAGLDGARRAALTGLLTRIARKTPILLASQDAEWLAGLEAVVHHLGDCRVDPTARPQLVTPESERARADLPSPSKKTD